MTNVPPAGWYDDGSGAPARRWWDGTQWTDHFEQVQAPPSPPAQPSASTSGPGGVVYPTGWNEAELPKPPTAPTLTADRPQQQPSPQPYATPTIQASRAAYNFYDAKKDAAHGRNTFATNAFVLGILTILPGLVVPWHWLALIVGAAAIVWGILGTRRASYSGIGRKRAVWGIVLGAVGLLAAIVILMASTSEFAAGVKAADGKATAPAGAGYKKATLENDILTTANKQLEGSATLTKVTCPTNPTVKEGATFDCVGAIQGSSRTMMFSVHVEDSNGDVTWKLEQ